MLEGKSKLFIQGSIPSNIFRFARILSKSGNPNVRVSNYKVVNVLGNCKLPFALDIMRFSEVRIPGQMCDPLYFPIMNLNNYFRLTLDQNVRMNPNFIQQ